jgi:hypothetical protein
MTQVYKNRYHRAARVINNSLNRTGRLPTEARLVSRCGFGAPTARYILMAWRAYCGTDTVTESPNRYQRAAWCISRSLKRNGKLPTADHVAQQCALSENIATATLAAWEAFSQAA